MSLLTSRYLSRLLRSYPVQRCSAFMSTEDEAAAKKKKRKAPELRVNIIDRSNLTVMSMESASKIANKRGVKLSKVENPLSWMQVGNRPAFEFLEPGARISVRKASNAKELGFKGTKHAIFSGSIHQNDIQIKIKQIIKWLKTGFVTEIAVDVSEKKDTIVSTIEKSIEGIAKLPGTVKKKSPTLYKVEYKPLAKSEPQEIESNDHENNDNTPSNQKVE